MDHMQGDEDSSIAMLNVGGAAQRFNAVHNWK
jgi:hypothetical protein